MNERIHDEEPDTSEPVARALLAAQCPQWADAPLHYVQASGTDNAMWQIGLDGEADVVMRLPRRPGAAAGVEQEVAVLRRIESAGIGVATPLVRHVGSAGEGFPHTWSVLEWIGGADAWSARAEPTDLAADLAAVVQKIGAITDVNVHRRTPGSRGGPLGPLIEEIHRWLQQPGATERIDVGAVTRLADEARELVDDPVAQSFVHGDLIPGNLLVAEGRLSAVIDWGGAGWGDPAQDLAPAWAVLDAEERAAFRAAVEVDEATGPRARRHHGSHARPHPGRGSVTASPATPLATGTTTR